MFVAIHGDSYCLFEVLREVTRISARLLTRAALSAVFAVRADYESAQDDYQSRARKQVGTTVWL
jgi:hypothetical protein